MSPYGCLGRTGWLVDGHVLRAWDALEFHPSIIASRWLRGGHSTYFSAWNIEMTFRQILHDITTYAHLTNHNASTWRN